MTKCFLIFLAALVFVQMAEAGMLMGKGAGRGVSNSHGGARPWNMSRRYRIYKEMWDRIRARDRANYPLPVNNHGPGGLPEPCVGVCYYQKQLAAQRRAAAANRDKRGQYYHELDYYCKH